MKSTYFETHIYTPTWIFLGNWLCKADNASFCRTVIGLPNIANKTYNWCYIDNPSLQNQLTIYISLETKTKNKFIQFFWSTYKL